MRHDILKKAVVFFCLGGLLAFGFGGCGAAVYRVDYGGDKAMFRGAKDSYRAGRTVTLYYDMIATDTDYAFYLDGERLNTDYTEKNGFRLRFTMPAHDVRLTYTAVNSMTAPEETLPDETGTAGTVPTETAPTETGTDVTVPTETEPSETDAAPQTFINELTFSSYDGGGPQYGVTVADETVAVCRTEIEYKNKHHEEMTGAPFTVRLVFTGLTPGETTATVSTEYPARRLPDRVFTVTVDASLTVTLTEQPQN